MTKNINSLMSILLLSLVIIKGHVASLLTLKANWFDTLAVKQWEIMINKDVLLVSVTNEETPYEQLLNYCYALLTFSEIFDIQY